MALKIEIVNLKYIFCLILIFCCFDQQSFSGQEPKEADFIQSTKFEDEQRWVNSIFDKMTPDERLGQLFMIRAHSDKGPDHIAKVEAMIKQFHVGGLCFFQGTPEKQAKLTNKYQKLANHVPLMISMDAEWGLGMRLKENAISFPRQLMLGAIQDNTLIHQMGKEIARQLRRLGVHVNFAPVADVNNNPENPVINTRSFGEDRLNVAVKSYMYAQGLQDGNVMACAKHFPGHGDTNVDSHLDLPIIQHDRKRLDSIELFPFEVLAQHGIQSMMIAHLHVPVIDPTPNLPTTLSPNAINNILKNEIGYDGLIFTDGLGMKGVSKHHKAGEVEAKCLVAGNEVLLLPQDVNAAVRAIKKFLEEGKLKQIDIDTKVKKILKYKYRLDLINAQSVVEENIRKELNTPAAKQLKRKLIKNAITLVRDPNKIIPVQGMEDKKIAALSIGSIVNTEFQKTLSHYAKIKLFNVGKEVAEANHRNLIRDLKAHDLVFVSLHDLSSYATKNFGISNSAKKLIEELRTQTKVVLVNFGNPYSLSYFDNIECLVQAYQEDQDTQEITAQSLFGAHKITGRLPVTASSNAKFNDGLNTNQLFRLAYDMPEAVGLDSEKLKAIDSYAIDAIAKKATPGCVVLIAKDGKVVFEKAYGHHTYDKKQVMKTSDIFDLASLTKILSTTLAVMKLQEQGKLSIYDPIGKYLPELTGTNKASLKIEDIMAHHARLKPWIPFYEETVSTKYKKPLPKYYKKTKTDEYSIQVTDKLFMKNDYVDEIWKQIRDSELLSSQRYRYSDLGYYLLASLVEKLTGQAFEDYLNDQFYQPLGLSTACFNPSSKFSKKQIVPSERDKYFRQQKVHGYVHDMGAAMLGGVSGHAGLFANANDVAILMQLLLNNGYYGGKRYLEAVTIQNFTRRHPNCTRRGIGFDMRELNTAKDTNISIKSSRNTFGHLGFTGTSAWADPDHNLIYVFLSNRTYPSMNNYKLNKEDYRPKIQTVIYESMGYE